MTQETQETSQGAAPEPRPIHDPAELDQFLKPALDATLRVARARVEEDGPGAVPARLRPFLRVATLPRAGLTAARLAIDTNVELREAVAAEVDEETLGRGPWLWIARPDEWRDELDSIWEAWHEKRVIHNEEAEQRSTRRLLQKANESITKLEARVRQLEEILASTENDLVRSRAEVAKAEADRDGAVVVSLRLGEERAEAVRQLKATEERLATRTAELKVARESDIEPTVVVPSADDGLSRDELASALRHLTTNLDGLVRGVAGLAELIGDDAKAAVEPGSTTQRRRPVRVGRGIADDSTAAAEVLISLPRSVTFVDGYNLTMTAWPSLTASDQRRALERAATSVAVRTGSEIHLVFDGDEGGGAPSRSTTSAVRIRFTRADVEADDEILDLIGSVSLDRPVVVVSDDRRVRHGARARGANVVGSRQFQPLLLR